MSSAEHAAAARERADEPPRLLVDPHEDEALELLLALVQNAQSGIAGTGDLTGGIEDLPEHHFDVELATSARPNSRSLRSSFSFS